jgi:hypothetical protein
MSIVVENSTVLSALTENLQKFLEIQKKLNTFLAQDELI